MGILISYSTILTNRSEIFVVDDVAILVNTRGHWTCVETDTASDSRHGTVRLC
jgi:hypothetical protein